MNTVLNEILKKQYKRLINGNVIVINKVEYLVSKGFTTITMKCYLEFMKRNGVDID